MPFRFPLRQWLTMARTTSSEREVLRCSFCNKTQKDVTKLIAGPTVFICDECVGVCNDILADESPHEPPPGPAQRDPALDNTVADVVRCALCNLALPIDEAFPVPERGFLCVGCVDAVSAAIALHHDE